MDPDKRISDAVDALSEHFDSVRIMATLHENGTTSAHSVGAGNWYAQKASCEEFLQRSKQQDQAGFIAEAMAPPEEGEEWKP